MTGERAKANFAQIEFDLFRRAAFKAPLAELLTLRISHRLGAWLRTRAKNQVDTLSGERANASAVARKILLDAMLNFERARVEQAVSRGHELKAITEAVQNAAK